MVELLCVLTGDNWTTELGFEILTSIASNRATALSNAPALLKSNRLLLLRKLTGSNLCKLIKR